MSLVMERFPDKDLVNSLYIGSTRYRRRHADFPIENIGLNLGQCLLYPQSCEASTRVTIPALFHELANRLELLK